MSGIFFSYFGGKYMRSTHYPSPNYDIVIEPFAGAAGYSTRYMLGKKQSFWMQALSLSGFGVTLLRRPPKKL